MFKVHTKRCIRDAFTDHSAFIFHVAPTFHAAYVSSMFLRSTEVPVVGYHAPWFSWCCVAVPSTPVPWTIIQPPPSKTIFSPGWAILLRTYPVFIIPPPFWIYFTFFFHFPLYFILLPICLTIISFFFPFYIFPLHYVELYPPSLPPPQRCLFSYGSSVMYPSDPSVVWLCPQCLPAGQRRSPAWRAPTSSSTTTSTRSWQGGHWTNHISSICLHYSMN